jgi:hypothetical protein
MALRSWTLREWVVAVFAAIGVALLPWTVWLSASLEPRHVTSDWDIAWSGFDTGLALLFVATAIAAYRRSPWVAALAAALGTLLVVDAWFDVVLDSHWDERRYSIMLAAFAELPMAAVCFWIAQRAERLLKWAVDEAEEELELAPSGEGPPKGDLIRVFEVAPDREAAREPRDADTSA